MSLTKIKNQPNLYSGRGMAIAGLILGIVGFILTILAFIWFIAVFATFLGSLPTGEVVSNLI